MNLDKIILQGERVRLEPLSDAHLPGLAAAIEDGALWALPVTFVPHPQDLPQFLSHAESQYQAGKELAFATIDQARSEQQWAFATLRAVEHGRYVMVAGTTGISAAIAPDGREIARTAFFTPAYLDVEMRLRSAQTPATRWTVPLQWLLAAAAVAALVVAILQNGAFVRLSRRAGDRGVE